MSSRVTDIECPLCGAKLHAPCVETDHNDWDCFDCGLSIPCMTHIAGEDVIEALRSDETRGAIRALLPHVDFGGSTEGE